MKCNVTIDGVTWRNVNIDYAEFRDFMFLTFNKKSNILITPVDDPKCDTDRMIITRIKNNLLVQGRCNL